MGFRMIDRIVRYDAGKRLEAVKALSRCEEYLADHFPSFPVMPGVLMLEAMVQAGAWLLRLSDANDGPVFLLSEAKAVRYGNFVKPGDELRIEVELSSREGDSVRFKGKGRVDGRSVVVGRFTLKRQHLCAFHPELGQVEERIRHFYKARALELIECEREL